jgi:hypothetical protein
MRQNLIRHLGKLESQLQPCRDSGVLRVARSR